MNAWAALSICFVTALGVAGRLIDKQADRSHEIRWHDRFYQPQQAIRRGRIIDIHERTGHGNHQEAGGSSRHLGPARPVVGARMDRAG